MECFYHAGVQACGTCKSCSRGICKECASELDNGIACKDKCEPQAIEINELIMNSKAMENKANTIINSVSVSSAEIFNIILGALFFGFGFYESMNFIMYMGVAFLVFGTNVGVINKAHIDSYNPLDYTLSYANHRRTP
jgi:hypothetical protein